MAPTDHRHQPVPVHRAGARRSCALRRCGFDPDSLHSPPQGKRACVRFPDRFANRSGKSPYPNEAVRTPERRPTSEAPSRRRTSRRAQRLRPTLGRRHPSRAPRGISPRRQQSGLASQGRMRLRYDDGSQMRQRGGPRRASRRHAPGRSEQPPRGSRRSCAGPRPHARARGSPENARAHQSGLSPTWRIRGCRA
jgi:hypothetical protein